ncbi:MAG TPA: glycosyltransferase family 2 protein [Gaiellaceae bacterium]|nr:glycosyltransferase family 2 protein [Gaiellaceae bacterium]
MSVVVPTKDRWELLSRHGLRAALLQEGVDVEVVVVDDGSTDETPARLGRFPDDRVRTVRHERSLGQAAARNAGVGEARAPWVAFLDDDDLWAPGKLRDQLEASERAGADFAWSSVAVVDPTLSVVEIVEAPPAEGIARTLLERNVLRAGSSTVLARTAAVRRSGGLDPRLDELADWDLWIRLALAGRGASCPDVHVGYLVHPGNRRTVDDGDVVAEYEYLRRKHAKATSRLGVTEGPVQFSRWLAMGHRRRGERVRAAQVYLRSGVEHRNAGSLVRAGAALLGERAFEARRRLSERPRPAWLDLYR